MKLKSLLAVVALVVSANAQAAGEWRIGASAGTGGTSGSFMYTLTTPAAMTFGLAADYGHELSKNLQLIGLGSFGLVSVAGVSVTTYSIGAGLRYNFDDKIQESMFIQAAAMYTGAFGWKAGFGKRFKISDTVAYTPEVGVAGATNTAIYANLVNFSVWF